MALELLLIGPVALFPLAVALRMTPGNVPVGDSEIPRVPSRGPAEFTSVIGLDRANRHGADPSELVQKAPGALGGVLVLDAQYPDLGGFIFLGGLVGLPRPVDATRKELHINFQRLSDVPRERLAFDRKGKKVS